MLSAILWHRSELILYPTAATHFTFLREIPMFSQYEMRASIMSWDNKWVGVIANQCPSFRLTT